MIKRWQKWISFSLVVAFVLMLQAPSIQVSAQGRVEQGDPEVFQQGTGSFESIGHPADKRKSILPYMLIGGGVVAVVAILFLVVNKPKNDTPQDYNILGSWAFEFNQRGGGVDFTIVFSGNKRNGEFMDKNSPWMNGTYTVVDTEVTMLTTDKPDIRFRGQFTSADTMSGSWTYMSEGWSWTAKHAANRGRQ